MYLKESVSPSASARHQLLIRAIGEEELLKEILVRNGIILIDGDGSVREGEGAVLWARLTLTTRLLGTCSSRNKI